MENRKNREELIKAFKYSSDRKAFSVVFESGRKTREILFSGIPGFKGFLKTVRIARNRRSLVMVDSKSHNVEVPWDMLLHLGDPSYTYSRERAGETGGGKDPREIGRKIKQIRESGNISYEQLASVSGIARPNIYRIERGDHSPSLDTLIRLANALSCSLADFFQPYSATVGREAAPKTLEISKVMASLNKSSHWLKKDPVILTRNGKPVAALIAIKNYKKAYQTSKWSPTAKAVAPPQR